MNTFLRSSLTLLCGSLIALGGTAHAQGRADPGKREYEAKCATCHGVDGKGNGPSAGILSRAVPDITTLARRNGGVFPISQVYLTIEGEGVPAHGGRDMPIWGAEYRLRAGEHYVDVPYSPEVYVRTRILWLAEYLYRLQVK